MQIVIQYRDHYLSYFYLNCVYADIVKYADQNVNNFFLILQGSKISIQQDFDVWACLWPWIIFSHLSLYHVWKWVFFPENKSFDKSFNYFFMKFKSLYTAKFLMFERVSKPKSNFYTFAYLMCENGNSFRKLNIFTIFFLFFKFKSLYTASFWCFSVCLTLNHLLTA